MKDWYEDEPPERAPWSVIDAVLIALVVVFCMLLVWSFV